MNCVALLSALLLGLGRASGYTNAPLANGASISGLWPRQAVATAFGETPLELTPDFAFTTASASPRVARALARYLVIVHGQAPLWPRWSAPAATLPLAALDVALADDAPDPDAPPRLHDDESFALWVNASGARLRVAGFAGVQRGLEAFAQVDLS